MSLKNIGNIINAIKGSGNLESESIINALKDAGDLNGAGKILGQLKLENVGDIEKIKLLQAAFIGTKDEAAKAALGISELGVSTTRTISIFESFKNVLTGLGTVLKTAISAHPFIAIAAGIAVVTALASHFYENAEEANEAMRDSVSSYKDAQQELKSVNSELDDTKSRMNELLAKDSLTFVEQKELNDLKEATKELKIQQELREEEERKTAREVADDTVKAYKKNFGNYDISFEEYQRAKDQLAEPEHALMVAGDQDLAAKLAQLEDYKKLQEKSYLNDNTIEYKQYGDMIKSTTDSLWEQLNLLQEYKTNLLSSKDVLTPDETSVLNQITKQLEFAWSTLDPEGWKQIQFDDLLNTKEFSNAKNELVEMAKATNNVGITVDTVKNKYPQLAKAAEDAGLTIQDLVDNINSEAGILDIEEVSKQLKNAYAEAHPDDITDKLTMKAPLSFQWDSPSYADDFNNWIDSLSDEDIGIVYKLSFTTDVDNLKSALEEAKKSAVEKFSPVKLSALLTDPNEKSPTTFTEYIDQFQSDISTINSALDSIRTGEFKDSDITDLIQQFPELATQTDNLQKSLSTLTLDKLGEITGKIREKMSKMVDPKEYKAAEDLISNLMKTIDLSAMDKGSMEKFINNRIWSNITGEESINRAKKFKETFSKELSTDKGLEILCTLLADPTNAQETIENLKAKYADLEIEYDLTASDKSLEKLQSDLETLQGKVNKRQAQDNMKVALGGIMYESDYQAYIDNAKEQIANYYKQIGEERTKQSYFENDEKAWNEAEAKIQEYYSSIYEAQTNIAEWQKSINNIPVNNLQTKLETLQSKATEFQNALDMKEALGEDFLPSDYQQLIYNSEQQIANLEEQNRLLESQKQGLNPLSDGYKEIQSQIDSNSSAINDARLSQIEWNKEISNLPSAFLQSLESIQSVLDSQSSGLSLDPESFNSDELKDYREALEWTNGTLQLNEEKVREITKAKADEKLATIEEANAQAKLKYRQNSQEIQNLRDNYDDLTDAQRDRLNELLNEQTALVDQSRYWDLQAQSIREATGAYQEWLNKQNAPESGDMFDESINAWQLIRDTANDESDMYGRVGRKDYEAAVNFIVPDTIDKDDAQAVQSYLDSVSKYLYYDKDSGEANGLNINQFIDDSLEKGLLEIGDKEGEFKIAGGKTLENFAEGLNLSLPMVQAMFGEMEEFFPNFEWGHIEGLDDAIYKATVATDEIQSEIDQINAKPIKTEADLSELEKLKADLKEAKRLKEQLSNEQVETVFDKYQQYVDAMSELNQLQNQQDHGLGVEDSQIEEAKSKVRGLKAQLDELDKPTVAEIEVVISGYEGKKQQLEEQLAGALRGGAPENITAPIQKEIDALNTKIENAKALEIAVNDDQVLAAQKSVDKLNNTKIGDKEFTVTAKDQATSLLSEVKSYLEYIEQNKSKQISLTVNKQTVATSVKSGTQALNGTAHAAGTMQHAYGEAFADGSWGAKAGGTALVGELGREIVVDPRTGKWHTVGDNGAEFTNIPKGSIVFNHFQTEELLKNGFVNSRGLMNSNAYMDGTAFAGGNAYVNTVNGKMTYVKPRKDQVDWAHSPSNANTTATQKNTKATNANTKAVSDSTQEYDHIQTRLERWQQQIDKAANAITDFISAAQKISLLNREISATRNAVKSNYSAIEAYEKKLTTIALSDDWKNKIRNGQYSIEEIDTSTEEGKKLQEKIEKYQDWYNKIQDCYSSIQDLSNQETELFNEKLQAKIDSATQRMEKYEKSVTDTSQAYEILATNGTKAVKKILSSIPGFSKYSKSSTGDMGTQVALLNKGVDKNIVDKKQASIDAKKQESIAKNTYSELSASKSSAEKTLASIVKSNDKAGAKLISKYGSNLTASQKKLIDTGHSLSLKGVDPNSQMYKDFLTYNQGINKETTQRNNVNAAKQRLEDAKNTYDEKTQARIQADIEYAEAKANEAIEKLQNLQKVYDQEASLRKSETDLWNSETEKKKAQGYDLTTNDYQTTIKYTRTERDTKLREARRLQEELDKGVKSGSIAKGSEAFKQMQETINGLNTEANSLTVTMSGLYDEMRDNLYLGFERAYEASEKLRESYETLKDLINDEMNFDEKGRFTNYGLLNLDQSLKTYKSQTQDLQKALEQRQSYINRFNAVDSKGNRVNPEYSRKDFDEDMDAITEKIQAALSGANDARKEVISLLEAQAQAELDALNKVIDARKEALKKKEDYYNYDKQLKNKSKELQLLDQQIRALDGVTDAESRAQKARLEAQREEAKQELDDTVREHVVDLQIDGMTELQAQLQENYENYVKELNSNFDTMTNAMTAVANMIDLNSGVIAKAAEEILKSYGVEGVNVGTLYHQSAEHYASGTKRVPRNMLAVTQEKGRELITHDGGIITPLSQGDGVINNTLTERLLDMAYNSDRIMSGIANTGNLKAVKGNFIGNISPVIQCPITIEGNANEEDIINAINRAMPNINKQVQKSIRKDLQKAGW